MLDATLAEPFFPRAPNGALLQTVDLRDDPEGMALLVNLDADVNSDDEDGDVSHNPCFSPCFWLSMTSHDWHNACRGELGWAEGIGLRGNPGELLGVGLGNGMALWPASIIAAQVHACVVLLRM
jgi:hypothetical protein